MEERIEYLSSRWYVTASFVRCEDEGVLVRDTLPLKTLLQDDIAEAQRSILMDYVQHHRKWMRRDEKVSGQLSLKEEAWLHAFGPHLDDE